jgi:acyl carrier protein
MTINKKLYESISQFFNIPASEINDELGPEMVDNWDSFNNLVLADAIESEFNIKFTMNEVSNFKNVLQIKNYLKNHLVKRVS